MASLLTLREEIETLTRNEGIDLLGIADLTTVSDMVLKQGGQELEPFTYAISIGIGLSHSVVDLVANQDNSAFLKSYHHHVYQVINPILDAAALKISFVLQKSGFKALPVAASQRTEDKMLMGLFSHKLAANLSGLGWIGKSCLLITPQFGPRVRFATILTNAPLFAGTPMPNRCGKCQMCVTHCPARAFTGIAFNQDDSREKRFDPWKCETYRLEKQKVQGINTCGICVYICPHGKGAANRKTEIS